MSISLTDGKIFLVKIKDLSRLEFQFVSMGIGTQRTLNLIEVPILHRNHNVNIPTGGSERINFTIDIVADEEGKADLKEKVKWLQSLTYFNKRELPERVLFVWGSEYLLGDTAWVVTSVQPRFNLFDKVNNFNATEALVDVSMVADTVVNISREDI